MSFVHDPLVHSKVKGIEIWESFYIPWQGSWTEVKSEFGDEFQVNSSEFTGSIACQLRNGEANYSLYIDEHNAEFYFGKFVSSFLNGVLVPATTNNQYYDLSEAVRGYINCEKIAESVVNTIANLVGDWASGFITVSTFEGICETNVNVLVSKIDDYINELHVNDTAGGSDVFKFAGIVEIETRNTEAIKLKNGSFTGSLNLGEKRFFTGTWDAKKVK